MSLRLFARFLVYTGSRSLQRPFASSCTVSSGHNKWSKIKQRKGTMDAQKSAVYGKAYRDIMVAVRNGGSVDPGRNTALASILKKAKSQGVPKDNIENALAKASRGKDKGDQYVTYEALAPGSTGLIIECLTDNINRTLHNVREILTSHSARFATVGFLFQRKGYVKVALEKGDGFGNRMERLIESALEASAEDFEELSASDEVAEIEFTCPPNTLTKLMAAVAAPGLSRELLASELIYVPLEDVATPDEGLEEKVLDLVDALEDNEDTLRVWTTLNT